MTDIQTPEQDELTTLKAHAELMGIKHHPSIGLEKLRDKVNTAGFNTSVEQTDQQPKQKAVVAEVKVESPNEKRVRLSNEAKALVRIRLTCMNPAKKEWDGEIFTVGNAAIGSIKRFIPFNTADDGWHVPNIMLQVLRDRQCQVFTTERTKNGVNVRKGKLIREFNIEIMPPLTKGELNDLAQRQAMAQSIG